MESTTDLKAKIESILFFRNEPIMFSELSRVLGIPVNELKLVVLELVEEYKNRGIVFVVNDTELSLGTHPKNSKLIEKMRKEELSKELGRAGLEVLAIVLYKGPVSRREIDHIRGVNSSYTLRSLVIRGLIERADSAHPALGDRSYSYKPTIELLRFLGLSRREDLPDFQAIMQRITAFEETIPIDQNG